jgi:hypothetical protein
MHMGEKGERDRESPAHCSTRKATISCIVPFPIPSYMAAYVYVRRPPPPPPPPPPSGRGRIPTYDTIHTCGSDGLPDALRDHCVAAHVPEAGSALALGVVLLALLFVAVPKAAQPVRVVVVNVPALVLVDVNDAPPADALTARLDVDHFALLHPVAPVACHAQQEHAQDQLEREEDEVHDEEHYQHR